MTAERERLEVLREVLRSESISWGELHELQSLAAHIEPGDVELLEAAGVPEFPDAEPYTHQARFGKRHEVDRDGYVRDRALSVMARGAEPGWDDMDEDGRGWAFRYLGDGIDALLDAGYTVLAPRAVCPECGSATLQRAGEQDYPTPSACVQCADCGWNEAV